MSAEQSSTGARRSCGAPSGAHLGTYGWRVLPWLGAMVAGLAGCMAGPDYRPPEAPVAQQWLLAEAPRITATQPAEAAWWKEFGDPALDELVETAYRQNLPLRAAGLRVIQAQARRGIAIGELFPQTQQLTGNYSRNTSSLNEPQLPDGADQVPGFSRNFNTFQLGFDAAWELDLWGRFRRNIEAADAELLAAVADYDDVLVSLIGEVAVTYVQLRVSQELLALARDNARIQSDSLEIARVRFEAGGTSDLDVQQAATLLEDTQADIPALEIQERRALDSLSVLLGMTPSDLQDVIGQSSGIPAPPPSVAVGIPADLLRRRPDVKRAERQLAAQSARIGVAVTDLLPRVQLIGEIGLTADDAAKLFEGRSFEGLGGPRFDWAILNYGRLINAVRVQDALFQELEANYDQTVLRAQQDVEDAVIGYVRGVDSVSHLERSVAAANRAVELSLIQYTGGAADYTRVLTAQQAKITADRRLTDSRGSVTTSVIALYKALGGGWELRDGNDFVPEEVRDEMQARTYWGGMLKSSQEAKAVEAASTDTASDEDPGFLRWRWWWPQW